jgi:CHAT domain-containing protein
MICFYEEWLDNNNSPALALAKAQFWLASTTNATKLKYLSNPVPFPRFESLPEDVRQKVSSALSRLQAAVMNRPESLEFVHPYFWAGFYYAGA